MEILTTISTYAVMLIGIGFLLIIAYYVWAAVINLALTFFKLNKLFGDFILKNWRKQ
jgi:hypothetical protein